MKPRPDSQMGPWTRAIRWTLGAVLLMAYIGVGVSEPTGALASQTPSTRLQITPTITITFISLGAPMEGVAVNGTVAQFTTTNASASAATFNAVLTWGDGTTTSATVTGSTGHFSVIGSHVWSLAGSYQLVVQVTGTDTSFSSSATTVVVIDAPLSAAGATLHGTEGAAVTGIVATFTDANPYSVASSFSASIGWGDGTTTAATITGSSAAGYSVTGTHSYAGAGSMHLSVSVTDTGGATTTAASTALVSDAPLTGTGMSLSGITGIPMATAVASFVDANPVAAPSMFLASIQWGDGTTTAAGVVANSRGGFDVTGTHVYAGSGIYAIMVQIGDVGGSTASVASSCVVASAPTFTPTPSPSLAATSSSTPTAVPTSTPTPSNTATATVPATSTVTRIAPSATAKPTPCSASSVKVAEDCLGARILRVDVHTAHGILQGAGILVASTSRFSYVLTSSELLRRTTPSNVWVLRTYPGSAKVTRYLVKNFALSAPNSAGKGALAVLRLSTSELRVLSWTLPRSLHAGQAAIMLSFVSARTHASQGASGRLTSRAQDVHDGNGRLWLVFNAPYRDYFKGAAVLSKDGRLLGIAVKAGPQHTTLVLPAGAGNVPDLIRKAGPAGK